MSTPTPISSPPPSSRLGFNVGHENRRAWNKCLFPAAVTSSRAVPTLASRWSRGRFVGTLVGGEVDFLEVEGVLDWG